MALLGGAMAARPLRARAPQKVSVIGFLSNASPDTITANVAAFREGLSQDGYVKGRNFAIEYHSAEAPTIDCPYWRPTSSAEKSM